MISIVLPTYNGSKYIRESINSIIAQTYKDWELIVIDDCSTDDTNKIVSEYSKNDSRVSIYKNETNQRLPKSLNIGFKKTKGDFLTWTSDDNIFKPNALERLVTELKSNPQVGLVFSAMEYIDGEGKKQEEKSYVPEDVSEIKYKNIVGACFMYSRRVYEEIGDYIPEKFLVEDYDYWIRISRKFELKYVKDVLYEYRVHGGSLTATRNKQMFQEKIKLMQEVIDKDQLTHNIQMRIYCELTEAYFGIDDYSNMKKYVKLIKKDKEYWQYIPKKVRISYYIGPSFTKIIKKIKKAK